MPLPAYELTRCPICDDVDVREVASPDDMRDEVERLWAFHQQRLRPETPPEALTDRVAFSQYPPLRLVQCCTCSHLYRNPRERETALADAYAGATPDNALLDALYETQRAAYRAQAERLTRVIGRPGRVLEVGSYVGGFLAAARERGWDCQGVDVNTSAAAYATRRGFSVTTGTLDDVTTTPPFAVVAIWNTFEQLPDVRLAVYSARRLLREHGYLVVRIPNGAFYAWWRRRLIGRWGRVAEQVLAHNNLLTFPYRQGFTHESIVTLFREVGLEVVFTYGDTLVPIADRWTTRYGALEERLVKRLLSITRRGWHAPWVEVYTKIV